VCVHRILDFADGLDGKCYLTLHRTILPQAGLRGSPIQLPFCLWPKVQLPNDFPSAAAASGAGPRVPLARHCLTRAGLARRLPKALDSSSPITAAVTRAAGCCKGVLDGASHVCGTAWCVGATSPMGPQQHPSCAE